MVDRINTILEKFRNPGHMAESIDVKYSMINTDVDRTVYEDEQFIYYIRSFVNFCRRTLFINGNVDFAYDGGKTCNIPQLPVDTDMGRPTTREYMMTVWLSASVFNCLLEGLHWKYRKKWLPIVVRETPHLGAYLGTRSILLGHIEKRFII